LARIEGRPVGLIANNPLHLGGAIDAPAADKAARFMQLCNAHGLPLVSLVDTPGFMVGPEVEQTAQVRHVSRLFVTAAHLRVPFFSVVLRKGYGLGAMGMAAGGFHAPVFTIAWPTGEFGAMGLEGAVRLGFRKELEALPEGPERDALFQKLVAKSVRQWRGHAHGRHAGDRRRHRPGGHARLAGARPGLGARGHARPALRRYLVREGPHARGVAPARAGRPVLS
jgi:acetyl-CoA carboxylase carboxyltransferase component